MPHPLLTACEGATFDLVLEQGERTPVTASGTSAGGLIVFQAPAIRRFETAKPIKAKMTVTSIPPGGPTHECAFSRGQVRSSGFILLRYLGKDRWGIDLEDLR